MAVGLLVAAVLGFGGLIWLLSPRGAGAHDRHGDGWRLLGTSDECCGFRSPVFADDELSLRVLWETSFGPAPQPFPEVDWATEIVIGLTDFHDSCGPNALKDVVLSGSGVTLVELRVAGPRGPLVGTQDCDAIAIPHRFVVALDPSRLGQVVTHHPINGYGIEIDLESGQSWSLLLDETDSDEMVTVREPLWAS